MQQGIISKIEISDNYYIVTLDCIDGERTAILFIGAIEHMPNVGDVAYYNMTRNNTFNIVAIIGNTQSPSVSAGEIRITAYNENGEMKSYVYIKSDGTIELNGSENFTVFFNELKSGFDELKSDFNSLIFKYNTHKHAAPSGVTGPPDAQGTASQASIDASKNTGVLL